MAHSLMAESAFRTSKAHSWTATQTFSDNTLCRWGTGGDLVIVLNSAGLSANEELTDVIVGNSVFVNAIPANSGIISNITNDGDIVFFTATGGNSIEAMRIDGSAIGNVVAGTSNSWGLRNVVASSTAPTLVPSNADLDTGIGHASGGDNLSLIVGAFEMLRFREHTGVANYVAALFDAPDQVSLTSASGSTWRLIQTQAINVDWDGGTTIDALNGQSLYLDQITNTADQATTVTIASTLYIKGAPIDGTSITTGALHAIHVDDGSVRFDGIILSNAGAQTICAANGNLASANGVASFGPADITSITIVNGIVTAIA